MNRFIILFLFFIAFSSCIKLAKRSTKHKTRNYCEYPANLMNWGRGRPLAVVNTQNDNNGVPMLSDVILDLTTKSDANFDAWCVSADIYLQSFTNGLCLNVDNGKLIAKSHCQMIWVSVPPGYNKNGWVEFRTTLADGRTLALTAHQNDDKVTLEEIFDENDSKKPLQKWNVHYVLQTDVA